MEKKSSPLVPAITATLLAAGAAGGAYYYFNGSKSSISGGALGNAKLIPSQALMAGSITTDRAAWQQLEQFQTPETKKLFDDSVQRIKKQALANSGLGNAGIDFDQDIQPWAGSVMFAILPPGKATTQSRLQHQIRYLPVADKTAQTQPDTKPTPTPDLQPSAKPSTAAEPNVLLVVEVKDKVSAAKFADKVKAKSNGKVDQKDYKGVQISQFKTSTDRSVSTALLGDYLVISPQNKAIENAIDTSKGDTSFAAAINPNDLELKNPLVQFYMPKFAESVQQLATLNSDAAEIPPQSLDQLKQIKSVTMGLGVDGDGLRLKGITKLDANTFKTEYKSTPGKVISLFPSETFGLLTGSDIKSRWLQFTQDATKNPDLQKNLEEARQSFKKEPFNIDIDKDIFGWMDGEFAIAAIATKEGVLAQYGALPALVLQTTDRATAESTLKKLETIAQGNSLKVSKKDVKGVSITEWSSPNIPSPLVGYGWNQPNSLFIGIGSLGDVIATKPATPLDGNQTFKTVTSSLAKSNIGYFYLDMDKMWALMSEQIPPDQKAQIPPETTALINTIRGIGITAAMPDKSTSKFEFLLSLKPKGGK